MVPRTQSRLSNQRANYSRSEAEISRARNRNENKPKTIMYETKDFIYNVFWCFKIKSGSNSGRSRYERYQKFQKDAKGFNTERDVVTMVFAFESLIEKICSIENLILQRLNNPQQNTSVQSEATKSSKTAPGYK